MSAIRRFNEPWQCGVSSHADDERYVVVRGWDGERVIADTEIGALHDAEEIVAKRIVECVNACSFIEHPAALAEALEAARKALGRDTPFPLADVIEAASNALVHLHKDHDCDRHGHEIDVANVDRLRQYAVAIRAFAAALADLGVK